MVLLSLLSSALSLIRITDVNRFLGAINHVSVPLGRLFTQIQSDAEVYSRELERSLGYSHWKDGHWKPRQAPQWIRDVLENEISRISDYIKNDSDWATPEVKAHWSDWVRQMAEQLAGLNQDALLLYEALENKNETVALEIYPRWSARVEEWKRQLQWGAAEYDRSFRQSFSVAEARFSELRTGLEVTLVVVVLLSLLLLWLGERTLRPLGELTRLAREITRRGLRKEDKSLLPEVSLTRNDEVSQLAREFHHMATALLEREKMVESQKSRLQEQNRLLRDMGELNRNILNSIQSILIVADLEGKITQVNPEALSWLGGTEEEVMGSSLTLWPKLRLLLQENRLIHSVETWRPEPITMDGRSYGVRVMPLRREQDNLYGAILALDDLTEERDLQERLRRAENLAAVGRMSAQVAHEVRNPLHSIGLEAEMAAEMAARLGDRNLKQSLNSILGSVDRLQKITENYLKLSRLSDGQKTSVDLGDVLESVLATYAPVCEAERVKVSWSREAGANLIVYADRDLLEQVLGNLFRNSLQALEGLDGIREVSWKLGNTESNRVWLRIQDSGPGISPEIKSRLFTPFVTTRAQGTGLGLSFVKKVLEDHHGTIELCPSERGACFEMILPPPMPLFLEEDLEGENNAANIARG